jgi:small subunit ribosomal protein S12
MSRINQIIKKKNSSLRTGKNRRKFKLLALCKSPHRKGICIKLRLVKPKKPNSAIRKIAKVKLTTGKFIIAYIPGQGHNLQEYSSVLVRGGRTRDLPGLKYKLMRGKEDFD